MFVILLPCHPRHKNIIHQSPFSSMIDDGDDSRTSWKPPSINSFLAHILKQTILFRNAVGIPMPIYEYIWKVSAILHNGSVRKKHMAVTVVENSICPFAAECSKSWNSNSRHRQDCKWTDKNQPGCNCNATQCGLHRYYANQQIEIECTTKNCILNIKALAMQLKNNTEILVNNKL